MNAVVREWRAFVSGLQFLTRLPLTEKVKFNSADYALSLAWYPAVGVVIGLLFLLPLYFLGDRIASVPLSAALVLAIWVAATGALHLDGLADCTDAWVGGLGDREKTLQILKDPRSGPMAVVALVVVLLLKYSAVIALIEKGGWHFLWAIPVLSRTSLIIAFQTFNYVSREGLGTSLVVAKRGGSPRLWISHGLVGMLSLYFLPMTLLMVWLCVGLVIYSLWRRSCAERLGGFNGDCAGTLLELLETGWLVSAVIVVGATG